MNQNDSLSSKHKISPYTGAKLFICDEYKDGKPYGISSVFKLTGGKRSVTAVLDLKSINKTIGSNNVDIRLMIKKEGKEKSLETLSFDVLSDWSVMFFKDVTFYQPGFHRLVVLKPDGTPVATTEFELQ